MSDKATLLRLIDSLPAAKRAVAARVLDALQTADLAEAERWPDALEQQVRESVVREFRRLGEPRTLYNTDFYAWTKTQAAALRHEDWAALDVEHLAEEIDDLGSNNEHAIEHQLVRLLFHLLKLRYTTDARPRRGWQVSAADAREQIDRKAKGSLRRHPEGYLPVAYRLARRKAALRLGRPLATFPETCPWTLIQVRDEDFWPEMEGEEGAR